MVRTCEIRTTAARHDGLNARIILHLRGGDDGGATAGTSAEVSDVEVARGIVPAEPLRHRDHAIGKEGYIEAQLSGHVVDFFLVWREQVEEEGTEASFLHDPCYVTVPRTDRIQVNSF